MKSILIFLLRIYQATLSPALATITGPTMGCRFEITCSEYAIRAIRTHGALRGSYQGFLRLMHCQPFSS